MSITDVQWVLGHAHLTTTQIYTTPNQEDVVTRTLAHYQRVAARADKSPTPADGYDTNTLDILFGERAKS